MSETPDAPRSKRLPDKEERTMRLMHWILSPECRSTIIGRQFIVTKKTDLTPDDVANLEDFCRYMIGMAEK